MADCPQCHEKLTDSQYILDGNYKSCPRCSTVLGRHAYYQVQRFGQRHHHDGTPFIQSYCPICRGSSGRIGDPELLCP